jgi:chromosome segregation ATPase
MPTREEITAIRDAVAQSNATISEIAGDMAELSANNATLVETVARLEQQIRDMNDPALDALVGEVKAAVDAQSAALRSIADVVPEVEPSPSPTPSPEPGPPPAEPTFRRR